MVEKKKKNSSPGKTGCGLFGSVQHKKKKKKEFEYFQQPKHDDGEGWTLGMHFRCFYLDGEKQVQGRAPRLSRWIGPYSINDNVVITTIITM